MRRRICLCRLSRIEDVLGVVVERAEGGERGDEHPHRVGVVVEAVDEPLAHVLVDERVMGDVEGPLGQLSLGRQLAVQQEVGDLEVGGVVGELLDGVAAVAQDAVVTVEIGDLRLARRRRQERRVVHEQVRVELAQRGAGEHPVGDRDRHRLASAVVGDRDGVGHEHDVSATRRCHFSGALFVSPHTSTASTLAVTQTWLRGARCRASSLAALRACRPRRRGPWRSPASCRRGRARRRCSRARRRCRG